MERCNLPDWLWLNEGSAVIAIVEAHGPSKRFNGFIAASTVNTPTFEGMYSVFTCMVSQRTYEAIPATPLEVRRHPGGRQALPLTHAVALMRPLIAGTPPWRTLHCTCSCSCRMPLRVSILP